MTVTSTGARASALAASRPPKPAPTTTTFGRRATLNVDGLLFSILMVDPRNRASTLRNSRRRLKMLDQSAPSGASLNVVQGVLSPAIRLAYELLIGSLSSSV